MKIEGRLATATKVSNSISPTNIYQAQIKLSEITMRNKSHRSWSNAPNNSSAWSNKLLEMHKSRDSHVSIKSEWLLDTLHELSRKQFRPRMLCSFARLWCKRALRSPNIIFGPFTDKKLYASYKDWKIAASIKEHDHLVVRKRKEFQSRREWRVTSMSKYDLKLGDNQWYLKW